QSPIAWYTQAGRWDLSPGYEAGNKHFERPIADQCLYCHANHADLVEGSVNRYREPIFQGMTIGCERCHGPGELHVARQQVVDGKDLSIVNPAHLEPALRDSVCQQCHLQGDVRLVRAGRELYDYRPGLPLHETLAIFFRSGRERGAIKAVG